MGCFKLKPSELLDTSTLPSLGSKRLLNTQLSALIEEFSSDRRSTKEKSAKFDPRLNHLSTDHAEIEAKIDSASPVSRKEQIQIFKLLSSHFIFNFLSPSHLTNLTHSFKFIHLETKKIIYTEGDSFQHFYIISSGSVEVLLNNQRKAVISTNGHFGESGLLFNSKSTSTIKTLENTECWVLKRNDFKHALQLISNEKLEENKEFLMNFQFFNKLLEYQRDFLISSVVVHEFEPGQRILRERDKGNLIYFIKKGQVLVSIDGVQLRTLGPGEYFGEQALIYKTFRTASVDTLDQVTLLSLDSKEIANLLGSEFEYLLFNHSLRISMEKNHHFSKLHKNQIEKIIETVEIKYLDKKEILIQKGEFSGFFVIFILKGEVLNGNKTFKKFEIIGENDLYEQKSKKYDKNFVTLDETVVAKISKQKFEEILGKGFKEAVKMNKILNVLEKVNIFRNLSKEKIESLAVKLKIEKYEKDRVILKQSEEGEKLFILKKGEVVVKVGNNFVREVVRHDYFGERSLIFNENRTATVISKGCTCWVLQKQDFLALITPKTHKMILKRIELQNDSLSLKSLKILKQLGKGTYGNVFTVYNSKSNNLYALKTVSREKIETHKIQKDLTQEKKILSMLDHPFIIKLIKTFKDSHRVYLVMELVQGIDFFDLLRKFNSWEEEKARFYISCLVLILEYLHERKVIYRDLKPENIIIDQEGYPKLIDFGLAKVIQGRTYSVAGSSHYMAPEIIKGLGYGLEADYWSLGVIIYEILCNQVPWGEHEEDPMEVYNLIVKNKIILPSNIRNHHIAKLLQKLLSQIPASRGNIESIKKDVWFISMDFNSLLEKNVPAPFKPAVEDYSKLIKSGVSNKQGLSRFIMKYEDGCQNLAMEKLDKHWDFKF